MAPPFAPKCLCLDIETAANDTLALHKFGAWRPDNRQSVCVAGRQMSSALAQIDALTEGAAFVVGHNVIRHDLPALATLFPGLKLNALPAVDTLELSPLAFPENPYHSLVKDYKLVRDSRNDPLKDAQLSFRLWSDQREAFIALQASSPDELACHHYFLSREGQGGVGSFFATLRGAMPPNAEEIRAMLPALVGGKACPTQLHSVLDESVRDEAIGRAFSYVLAWLRVSGGNSVLPPWVRLQYPDTGRLIRQLRDTPCGDPACPYCSLYLDPLQELARYFNYAAFRPEPPNRDGGSLQEDIVRAGYAGESLLAILPTGGGKSICYQLPALSRHWRNGSLTIIVSPLQSLMKDQVDNLIKVGIYSSATLNGMLTMPERRDVLDKVRLGDIGILLVSPEQFRNRAFIEAIRYRQIGAWVFDEAHCLSKWGNDFRPDYLYVSRFIRERYARSNEAVAPISCFTATAKREVLEDIHAHFAESLGLDLRILDGGHERENLNYEVIPVTKPEKNALIHRLLEKEFGPSRTVDRKGGAVVFAARRKSAEEISAFLKDMGWACAHFHAGLDAGLKKDIQQSFIAGELKVIVATNAFGMGVDKPDVRIVIHAEIPGSLENYLQEAGRAGRDRAAARCVLLYVTDDVERQHSMSASSRLSRRDIQSVLRALRQLQRKKSRDEAVVATSGEILDEDDEGKFKRDGATDDTRVRTAIAWLEEAGLVRREENAVQIFPSALRVKDLAEADRKLASHIPVAVDRKKYLNLLQILMVAPADEGISTDELMASAGFDSAGLRHALYLFDQIGIASNDTAMTAYIHVGVERSSKKRFDEAALLEKALLAALREAAPDIGVGEDYPLHLRLLAQQLKDQGYASALPQRLRQIIAGLAGDGRDGVDGKGSLMLKRAADPEMLHVALNRPWSTVEQIAERRRSAADRLLDHWLASLPAGSRGVDLLAETTLGKLTASVAGDALLVAGTPDLRKLVERALLWLHEQEVLRLNKGLAIFRAAMTLHLESNWKLQFEKNNYLPLQLHYSELTRQIHIMAEYAERGVQQMADALRLAMDYFRLSREEFCRRWLPGRESELDRQTTPQSWESIVETLAKPHQRSIVTDDRENANVLVLAGPGSGKTRVLVHRIAYLIRMRRENPRAILALAYNRHAALEIRHRLGELIGDDARAVTVLTCHALAMRLVGASFAERRGGNDADFEAILDEATALLEGNGLPPEDADQQRDRLLAGFRWILVDEYQDIGPGQYALISALAGRKRSDEDGRLNLFAVGDDDQNIYAFAGASVEFIRRFASDYQAKPLFLVENYRSTANIIDISNRLIAGAGMRMKQEQPIRIDASRIKSAPGGDWQTRDSVVQGRVQLLPAGQNPEQQALAVFTEIRRLAVLGIDLNKTAVIARQWKFLDPLRAACESAGIAVAMADDEAPPLWRLRETQALLAFLDEHECAARSALIQAQTIRSWLSERSTSGWWAMLHDAMAVFAEDTQNAEVTLAYFRDWLAEWGRASRSQQNGLLLLTAHRAKGLEFDHVFVLDGAWQERIQDDPDAARRLYYVAMTRARKTLTLTRMQAGNPLIDGLANHPALFQRPASAWLPAPGPLGYRYITPSLGDIDLGFAGRKNPAGQVHRTIADLQVGDPVTLVATERGFRLDDAKGQTVGHFSQHFAPPPGLRCIRASVRAILVWRRQDSAPEYQARCQCERWEVVLPELIFSP